MKRSPRLFRKLKSRTAADRYALGKAVTRLAGARLALSVLPFRMVRRIYARPVLRRTYDKNRSEHHERMLWALDAAGRRVLGQRPCLAQALVGERMLRAEGLAPELRIGVTKGAAGEFLAHAWVECDGEIVIGRSEKNLSFVPLHSVHEGSKPRGDTPYMIESQAQDLSAEGSAGAGTNSHIDNISVIKQVTPSTDEHDLTRSPNKTLA